MAEDVVLHVGADVSDLDRGMDKANKSVDKFEKNTDSAAKSSGGLGGALGGLISPIGLATAGIGLLGAGLFKAVDAAKEEAVGIERLNSQLKNSIPGWDGNTAAIEAYIATQEKKSFADDQLRTSLGLLVTQTGSLTEAQALQATAMDLARHGNIDLEKATRLMLKADDESFAALGKLGIQIDKNATKEQALAAIRQATSGQAEQYANSAAGAQERLGNMMGNVMEDIGGVLLPMLTTALQGAIAAFEWLTATVPPVVAAIGGALAPAIAFIAPIFQALQTYVGGVVEAFGSFFGTITSGGDIMGAFGTLFSDLGTNVMNLATSVGTWLMDALPGIISTLGQWAEAFWKWITDTALPGLMSALEGLGQAVWGWITGGGLQGLISNLVTWGGAILNWIGKDVLPFLGQKLLDLGTFIWNWLTGGGLEGLIKNLVTWGGAILGWIAKDVLPFIGQKLLDLGTFIWNWITGGGLTTLIGKLVEWGGALLNWIAKDVLPFIGGKLMELGTAIWTWITETAKGLVTKLGEWATSFWTWITTTAAALPGKIAEIATAIWTWITETAKAGATKALQIGKDIIDGIINGLKNAAGAVWDWLTGFLGGMVQGVKDFFGITSPSKLMEEEVGRPIIQGIVTGMAMEMPEADQAIYEMSKTMLGSWGRAMPPKSIFDLVHDAVQPGVEEVYAFFRGYLGTAHAGLQALIGMMVADSKQGVADILAEWARLNGTTSNGVPVGADGIPDYQQSPGGVGDPGGGGGGGPRVIPLATGFNGWVRKPTYFLAGEGGPEYMTVTPKPIADNYGGRMSNIPSGSVMPGRGGQPIVLELNGHQIASILAPDMSRELRSRAALTGAI